MSVISRRDLLQRVRKGRKARTQLVDSNVAQGIAFQIRATRDKAGMSQAELASNAGMSQNNLSRLESPDYGKHTITSLKRIADALDVALIVRFVPFSQYVDWLSGTPFLDTGISPESLAVPSFEKEEAKDTFEQTVKYWQLDLKTLIGQNPIPPIQMIGGNTGSILNLPGLQQSTSPLSYPRVPETKGVKYA